MPSRSLHHVEFSVLDYDRSISFYDRMFGYLNYKSFWTLNIGYKSTYYVPSFWAMHSYIGIQPALTGSKLDPSEKSTGIHHVAIWASNRKQVDSFYRDFLLKEAETGGAERTVKITEEPAGYFYAPGYYAVFFDDEINGIHWELAYAPRLISPWGYLKWKRAFDAKATEHDPSIGKGAMQKAMRKLPKP